MGNKQQLGGQQSKLKELSRNNFEFLYVIGKGGFGKVWKVLFKKYKIPYALKEMSKAKIVDKKSEKSIRYERELLARLKHPFIVNMHYAFQDFEHLYIVLDLLTGGDLRYHVSRYRKFSEEQTKFFMACIILSLDYIHDNDIIHRDIKPENLVLDELGFVGLTDFGIAKLFQKENSSETSGTPGYMAPEVMCAQNHTHAVDYFALGIIGYEFMMGKRPYLGKSRKEIKEQIMSRQAKIKLEDLPDNWTPEAADLINKLLQRKPINRLGIRGAKEVKDHPWFTDFPWKDLYAKRIKSPFIPRNGDNFDKNYCGKPDKIGEETLEKYEKYLKDENTQYVFRDFLYINQDLEIHEKALNYEKSIRSAKNLVAPSAKITPVTVKKDLTIKQNKSLGMLKKDSNTNNFNNNKMSSNSSSGVTKISVGSSLADFNKYKVDKFVSSSNNQSSSSNSTLDTKGMKLKKSASSYSTNSLLKQPKNISSNLTSNGVSIISSNLSQHTRTKSSSKSLSNKHY